VDQDYDLLEVYPNGTQIRRMSIHGFVLALNALAILGQQTHNECVAANLLAREIIGRVNQLRASGG
jgi:hypothetical protein